MPFDVAAAGGNVKQRAARGEHDWNPVSAGGPDAVLQRLRVDPRHPHARPARVQARRLFRLARSGRATASELSVRELLRSNDAVLISAVEALLKGADIHHMVVDQNISVLEGSIGIFPRRILVGEDELAAAQRLLEDAGFGRELRRDVR
jgi:hypothetical protein